MKDYAHEETDKQLSDTEKEITRLYKFALDDIQDEINEILPRIDGGETASERVANAQKYDRLSKLEKQIADIITTTNKQAISTSTQLWIDTYIKNYDWGAYEIESTLKITGLFPVLDQSAVKAIVDSELTPFSFMALDELKDRTQIIKDLNTQFVTGLAKGESIPKIAKRIQTVTEKNYNQSVRIARTETTRVESAARYDAFKYGETEYDIEQEKEWVATKDSRTRDTHRKADGQIVDLDQMFSVGRAKGAYPGDLDRAEEDINCRCRIITRIKGFESTVYNRQTYSDWDESRKNLTDYQISKNKQAVMNLGDES